MKRAKSYCWHGLWHAENDGGAKIEWLNLATLLTDAARPNFALCRGNVE